MIQIDYESVEKLNEYLADPNNSVVRDFWNIVEKYGSVDEINQKASDARQLSHQLEQLEKIHSPFFKDLEWLIEQRDKKNFISIEEYRKKTLSSSVSHFTFDPAYEVTLEISACQYFPWLITEAQQAVARGEIMPGRFIRVRNMKEQVTDRGDIWAMAAAMNVMGSSYVETLDTRGTDGSNVHLGGPDTITGYFGGVGQPNRHALQWLDEYLHYYTLYGITQTLNINLGTVLLGLFLRQIGVRNEFKISVFLGLDNPFSLLAVMMLSRLFVAKDGSTSLAALNFSNSVDEETIVKAAGIRARLGLEDQVRFDHHITEAYQAIVKQPYNRREQLLRIAKEVRNISAKHEGGDPEVEQQREHPSSILSYFLTKEEIEERKLMSVLEHNYLDKHQALNRTAEELTKHGLAFRGAPHLHTHSHEIV